MWLFLTRRLRRWLILAVLLPIMSVLVRTIRSALERRTGSTRLTRALLRLERLGRRRRRRG